VRIKLPFYYFKGVNDAQGPSIKALADFGQGAQNGG
jgi:hypothetical protein